MSKPKTVDESFTSGWNQTAAWAQSNNISTSSYLPVYQMDAARLQSGESPMSAAERNRAVLAAHNPNNVTPSPSDSPQAGSVFKNARSDLANIVTGLEPQHLITGLFDTVKNTALAVADPNREKGANLGITAANWLQNTLLSFVPGMYDVGAYMRADPSLGGTAGFKALADHPLLSLLDVMPADAGGLVAKTAMGSRLATAAGMTADQLAEGSLTKAVTNALSNRTWGMSVGIKPGDASLGIQQLSVGDKLQTWLQDSKLGTSTHVQNFVREYMTGNQLQTGIYQNLMAPAVDSYEALSDGEKAKYDDIFYRQDHGENLAELLKDPSVSLPTRDAVKKMFDGPVRFENEKAVAMSDVAGVRRPDGSIGLYSSKQSEAVIGPRDDLVGIRRDFLGTLSDTDGLVQQVKKYDDNQGKLADELAKRGQAAHAVVAQDKSALLENVTQEYKAPGAKKATMLTFGQKREQVERVFGPSGLVDQVVNAMKENRDDDVATLLPVLKSRLSKWGYESVDAGSNPAFAQVSALTTDLDALVKNRQTMTDDIDKRIVGEGKATAADTAIMRARFKRQKEDLEARHVQERKEFRASRGASYARLKDGLDHRLRDLNDLAKRMEDAAIAKGDNAALRASPAEADAIYRQVSQDIYQMRGPMNSPYRSSVSRAKLKSELEKSNTARKFEKDYPKLVDRQQEEVATLAEMHAHMREYSGQLTSEMRSYTDAIDRFHQALYDNPSDEYRNVELDVSMNVLLEHLKNSDELAKGFKEQHKLSQRGFSDLLQENPEVIKQLLSLQVDDVYNNLDNFSAELGDAVKEAKDDAEASGRTAVDTMIAQGYRPKWVPQAGPFDTPPSGIKAIVGKGTPTVDMALARAHKLTAVRHDAVIGVTKAMAETMRRDATVDFVEHSIVPKVVTGSTLKEQLVGMMDLPEFDPKIGTIPHAIETQLEKVGLTRFDSTRMFGFSMPRWENEATYLPTGLVRALEKVQDMESKGNRGLFDKSNQVFRYSILGLSPRYTAHITFGGTFLLALRSTPYMPSMLLQGVKAMRDGSLPEKIYRQPAQEGFGRMNYALREHAFQGGKQLGNLVVQENIEKVQGVLLHKASPFHYLKAAADVNFRFTRYVTRLQTAVAYLDYQAKAERKGTFVDDVTGLKMAMTPERAMTEGMHHVLDVFGDLRSMSPLERQVSKNIMPFYGWTRHILKYVLTMPMDHPWRAMILALTAFENTESVPKGLPARIQFLFFLGSPDKQGNVSAIDTRFMDPLRDVANYATLGGWIQSLNPVFLAPAAMMDPQFVYGSTSLYPNLTYNNMYGIETAGAQGNAVTGLEQFIPQLGAVQPLTQALSTAKNVRELSSNPNAFYKSIFNDLNIPFAQVQKINVKQIAAHDELARYQVAKQAATNAFQSGDFSTLAGYSSVPNPLNPDYEITPAELEAIYNTALAQYPGQQPVNVVLPPRSPAGW